MLARLRKMKKVYTYICICIYIYRIPDEEFAIITSPNEAKEKEFAQT